MVEPVIHNEKELLLRIANSDEQAFAELFEKTLDYFANYLFRLTHSTEMAEEIVQDVFMKIWTNRETLVEIQRIIPFLMIVSRNQAYMAIRKKMSEEKHFKNYQQVVGLQMIEDTADKEHFSALDEAINQLSPRAKEVYLMSRQDRLTYQQIAERLNISRETVKSHLEKATSAITQYLKTRFPELGGIATLGIYNVIRHFL